MTNTFNSVWDALEDTPEQAESMRLRSVFMLAIEQHVAQLGATQTEQARRLGITQPRLNDLLQGRIHKSAWTPWSILLPRPACGPRLNSRPPPSSP